VTVAASPSEIATVTAAVEKGKEAEKAEEAWQVGDRPEETAPKRANNICIPPFPVSINPRHPHTALNST